jgi:hypothetical protein
MNRFARWGQVAAIGLPTGFALALYLATVAPGLTWAHFGADGGDLLAAAATGGVPHPSGYPLYTLLLQGWLRLGQMFAPSLTAAYLGNLFSVVTTAIAAGVTAAAAWLILDATPRPVGTRPWARPLWAAVGGLLWAVAALPWSQALITEVYALHGLIAAGLGLLLVQPAPRPWVMGVLMGLGLSHHLTSVLLWPALLVALAAARGRRALLPTLIVALAVAGLLYARIPLAAAGNGAPPPVNWGYAVTWDGFWWLVGGAAYREYLFAVPWSSLAGRFAAAARVLVDQYTPIGAAIVLMGLAVWEQGSTYRRALALLWIVPVSLYAVGYNTVDSYIYLLPVVWLAALWGSLGLQTIATWLGRRQSAAATAPTALTVLMVLTMLTALALLVIGRTSQLSLRNDTEANDYLRSLAAIIRPHSLVVTRADAATFALWYGLWASDAFQANPDVIPVNDALYPYPWYRRLLAVRYPDVPGLDESLAAALAQRDRAVYFTEPPDPALNAAPAGPLWHLPAPSPP